MPGEFAIIDTLHFFMLSDKNAVNMKDDAQSGKKQKCWCNSIPTLSERLLFHFHSDSRRLLGTNFHPVQFFRSISIEQLLVFSRVTEGFQLSTEELGWLRDRGFFVAQGSLGKSCHNHFLFRFILNKYIIIMLIFFHSSQLLNNPVRTKKIACNFNHWRLC